MLLTGYNQRRDQIISSVEKFLTDCEKKGIITSGSLEESGGMGSYETFYITFEIPCNEQDAWTIRFSGHGGRYSNPDFSLWNDDFRTVTELKKAILNCFEEAKKC
jgi:hypothetical protein